MFSTQKLFIAMIVLLLSSTSLMAGQTEQELTPDVSSKIKAATQRLKNKEKYLLEYKLKPEQEIRWTVEHTVNTKTHMAGETEEMSSRSQSTKLWKCIGVDSVGKMTFVHSVESVNCWQKVGDGEPITYDSEKDEKVPLEYEKVAEVIKKPLAVISLKANGEVTDRKSGLRKTSFGTGDIAIPFPSEPISIGHKWYVPSTTNASDENGRRHVLKTRIHYELSSVKLPNAYIKFRTEILTPIESEKIRSQLVQQLTDGYLVFNIEKGLPVRKEVDWDEKVQGYEGPDSYLNYVGKMTEKLVLGNKLKPATGQTQKPKAKIGANEIKARDGKPVMRK